MESEFSSKVMSIRAELGLSLAQMSALSRKLDCYISDTYLGQFERGDKAPAFESLKNLVEFCLKTNYFKEGKELAEAKELWRLSQLKRGFPDDWFNNLLAELKTASTPPPTPTVAEPIAKLPETVVEHGMKVKPKGEGEVISWSEFQKGKIVLAKLGTFYTVRLTDAVTIMRKVCREYDPNCQVVVVEPNSLTTAHFIIEFRSSDFLVIAERDWDSGLRIMLTTENLPQLAVTLTIKAKASIAESLIEAFKRQPGSHNIKILSEW